MIWAALTLGFFGSLHCVGMCGPLAWSVSSYGKSQWYHALSQAFQYNIGRVITYSILGLLLGLLGEVIVFSDFQKVFSIIAGTLLIILFTLSFDLEKLLFKSRFCQCRPNHTFEI